MFKNIIFLNLNAINQLVLILFWYDRLCWYALSVDRIGFYFCCFTVKCNQLVVVHFEFFLLLLVVFRFTWSYWFAFQLIFAKCDQLIVVAFEFFWSYRLCWYSASIGPVGLFFNWFLVKSYQSIVDIESFWSDCFSWFSIW